MCRATKCRTCGKTTWAGCGHHVEQVLASVPTALRCPGHPRTEQRSGWLRGLLGSPRRE